MADLTKKSVSIGNKTAHSTFSDAGITLNWDGTAPTTLISDNFDYDISAETNFFSFQIEYQNAGVLNSTLSFRLPYDDDQDLIPGLGKGDGIARIVAIGVAGTTSTVNGTPNQCNCWIEKNASEEYTVNLTFASLGVISIFGTIFYHA